MSKRPEVDQFVQAVEFVNDMLRKDYAGDCYDLKDYTPGCAGCRAALVIRELEEYVMDYTTNFEYRAGSRHD